MNLIRSISGPELRNMLISAANAINAKKQEINELNVFPVPDGDTGTNMSMTMNAAVRELAKIEASTVSEVSDTAATALLRGARGNSGVILSLLFRGIAKTLRGKTDMTASLLAVSLQSGVEAAYKAVMKPAEGTILTVAREAAQSALNVLEQAPDDVQFIFETVVQTAKTTLAKTPDMLQVLKRAGVVDAGGKGLVVIFEAMLQTLISGDVVTVSLEDESSAVSGGAAGDAEEEINFTYCTEFIINKRLDLQRDPLALRAYLESMGDCVLVADDSTFIKVHVHTDNPGNAIQEALAYGYLTDIKIDNMRAQHEKKVAANRRVKPEKPVGFVTVASGTGVADLFRDLGADVVVEGGQSMNPSTEDILQAIEATPAEAVVVLPNNKNITMAAEQAASISAVKVHVLHTKTIPQGIAAMLSFNPDDDLTANLLNMEAAAGKVKTGLVTFAARDSEFDGKKITKDEILALNGSKIAFTDNDPATAAVKLTKMLCDKSTSFVTIIYGEAITEEQAEAVRTQLEEKLSPQAEINMIMGGQPVYHFIISVE